MPNWLTSFATSRLQRSVLLRRGLKSVGSAAVTSELRSSATALGATARMEYVICATVSICSALGKGRSSHA
jgi:hypothetical protein